MSDEPLHQRAVASRSGGRTSILALAAGLGA
jgi:hypothetical protein